MPLIATETAGSSFSPVPEGVHAAACCWLIDCGTQHSEQFAKDARKLVIAFELPEERIEIDGEDKSRIISRQFTLSLHENAALRAFLEAWRGKRFTAQELTGFDLHAVLGAPCQLQILHRENQGKTFANIASIMPKAKGAPLPNTEIDRVLFSIDDLDRNRSLVDQIPRELPEWISDLILCSAEARSWGKAAEPEQPAFNVDDEIPF
ncbi:MAG: hypothetical protein JXR59_04035 [Desulfuromonadaceae bacterium]|nr:hypothetical protein [Desulfuromonadaceae bacterium]